MYEPFTDRARKALQLANVEALSLNSAYLHPEHLLLGVLREGAGVASNVLRNLGIDPDQLRQEVKKSAPLGPSDVVTMGSLPQTHRTRRVIAWAFEEMHYLHNNHVDTEHLLLGLLREAEGPAAVVLRDLGLDLEKARGEVRTLQGIPAGSLPGPVPGETLDSDLKGLLVTIAEHSECGQLIRARERERMAGHLEEMARRAEGPVAKACYLTAAKSIRNPEKGETNR